MARFWDPYRRVSWFSSPGRAFSIPGVTVVVRQNGKIIRESLYYDMEEVRRQLG